MPLGASVNHAGSALYECAAAMFIAQAYGLHLSFATQFTVVVLALITSMGIAGIPAASLVGIAIILAAVGLPAEAIGVLLVLDRLLDMCRTAINVLADAACTVIVARLEGETGSARRAGRVRRQVDGSSAIRIEVLPSPASCGKLMPTVLNPASTYMISPVTPLARSEHRNAAALPTSSSVTLRRSGATSATRPSILRKPAMPAAASVLIGPGGDAVHADVVRPESAARKRTFASRLALASPMTL